jgi:hypothetical protein
MSACGKGLTMLLRCSGRITRYPDRTFRGAAVQLHRSATYRKGQTGTHLVDEVADVREDTVTQFHTRQTRTD